MLVHERGKVVGERERESVCVRESECVRERVKKQAERTGREGGRQAARVRERERGREGERERGREGERERGREGETIYTFILSLHLSLSPLSLSP